MKILFLTFSISFLVFSFLIAQPAPNITELNFDELQADTIKVQWLLEKAKTLTSTEAQPLLRQAYEIAQQNGNKKWLGEAAFALGTHISRHQNRDSSFAFLHEAETLATEINDKALLAYAYNRLGITYGWKFAFEKQIDYYLKAMEIWQELDNKERIAFTYQSLAIFNYKKDQHEESLKYYQKTFEVAKSIDYYPGMLSAYTGYADNYISMGDTLLALESINKGIDLFLQADEDLQKDRTLKRDYGQLVNMKGYAYHLLGNFDEAINQYNAAIDIFEDLGNPKDVTLSYAFLSWMFLDAKRYEEGIPYVLEVIDQMKKNGDENMAYEIHLVAAMIYKGAGNMDSAYYHLDTHVGRMQERHAKEKEELQKELMIKHQTNELNQEISSQNQIISQQKTIQMISLGGILLLAGFLLSLFLNYRNKQRLNNQLSKKNDENELLLKEIHHRVKNNLQVISSLLSLQSANIDDPKVLDAVQESQNRVKSMGLIHQKLYQGENLAAIEMKDYLNTLSESMVDSFGEHAENIDIECEMEELELDVDTAIPIGLIVNELVTNAIKYAFPGGQNGKINIEMGFDDDQLLRLAVSDNGVGIQKENASNVGDGTGFGSQLINLLTMQLNGKITQTNGQGITTEIRFKQFKVPSIES